MENREPVPLSDLIPAYLRGLRKAAGLSQVDLAATARINLRTIQRVESGIYWPSRYTVQTWERVTWERVFGRPAARLRAA